MRKCVPLVRSWLLRGRGVHLLVAELSPVAVWVLTRFEFYGVVWVIGLLRSVGRLPIVLDERGRLYSVDTRRRNYLSCVFMNAPMRRIVF